MNARSKVPADAEGSQAGPSPWVAMFVAAALALLHPRRAGAEDRVEYRYENYAEDKGRIGIQTHGVYVEKELTSKVTAHGQFVYDGISGATPTGGRVTPGSDQVPVQEMHDERLAGSVDAAVRYGSQFTTTPQISYSNESDYQSVGIALNQAIDFNQRNTTLLLGVARNFDRVSGRFQPDWESKGTWDGLIGINQLLSPKTTLTVNLTLSYADGYLTDPYKGVYISYEYPDPNLNFFQEVIAEKRPEHRFKQVLYVSLTQYVDSLHGSAEAAYRFHHDDFGVFAHTASLTWFQKIGKHVLVAPTFRYYWQTAASFYAAQFTGDPLFPEGTQGAFQDGNYVAFRGEDGFPTDPTGYQIVNVPALPAYYSSDYRLSRMETYTYGVGIQWKPLDWLSVNFAYKRYEMHGLDGVTLQSAYPKAHIFTAGLGVWF